MADYRYSGVHVLNDFISSRLMTEGILDPGLYNGITPFFPTQQTAFTNVLPSTFFIYNYQKTGREDLFPLKVEQAVYTAYDTESTRLRNVLNYMTDLLSRMDVTAQEVNDYANARGEYPNEFDFKYVRVISGNSPEPFTMPEGRLASTLVCRYEYTVASDNAGMRLAL